MAQVVPANPVTTNPPFAEAVPITEQLVDLSNRIESDPVPESEEQTWEIQIIEDPRLAAKVQFRKTCNANSEKSSKRLQRLACWITRLILSLLKRTMMLPPY